MDIWHLRNYDPETNTYQFALPTTLPRRPAQGNTVGKPIGVKINSFHVRKYPDKTIYQYDVRGPPLRSPSATGDGSDSLTIMAGPHRFGNRETRAHPQGVGIEDGSSAAGTDLDL